MSGFEAVALVIVAISVVNLYRLVVGRTLFDRMLALSAAGTNTIALIVLAGFIFARPDMMVDVAIAYSLLNFISVVAIAKYLDERKEEG